MIDAQDYSSKYADQYHTQSFETVMVEIRRDRVLASLQEHSCRRILEIGCGLEPLFPYLKDYEHYVIVEPSPEFVQHARSVALATGKPEIRVIEGYFEELPKEIFAGDRFDMIILSSLLHEVPDPGALLQAIRQVTDEQTVVHINVPNVYSFHRLLALEMGLIASIDARSQTEISFGRHTRFDRSKLITLVENYGFDVLSSGSYFIKPFSHAQMERIIGAGIVDSAIVAGLAGMVKYLPDMGCEIFVDVRPGGHQR